MRKVIWSKRNTAPWMWQAFKLLAKCKRLRGTALDIFNTAERRMERALITEYTASDRT
jgi:indolepyruvate ferredoxin oxidoreductase